MAHVLERFEEEEDHKSSVAAFGTVIIMIIMIIIIMASAKKIILCHTFPCEFCSVRPSALHCSPAPPPFNAGESSSKDDAKSNTCAHAGVASTATASRRASGDIVMALMAAA